jgi:hypothetical protein
VTSPEHEVPTLADVLTWLPLDDARRIVLGFRRSRKPFRLDDLLTGVPPHRAAEIRSSLSQPRQAARADREVPTLDDLSHAVSDLPADQAQHILAHARPRPPRPPAAAGQAPPPVYVSWEDFLARTTSAERRRWCAAKAGKANRFRLMSGRPETTLSANDVLVVLEQARGRCACCGSLAVERRPPGAWAQVGRRIGSLGHRIARFNGGTNTPSNLDWCCMWCNTWPEERVRGATDHGGYFPASGQDMDAGT